MPDENTSAPTTLGVFKTGETPLPLSVRFDDYTGAQLDISTYDAKAFWRARTDDPANATELAAVVDSGTNPLGLAVVTFTAAMVATAGAYLLEVWVGTAGNASALASKTYSYFVEDSIVTPGPTFS